MQDASQENGPPNLGKFFEQASAQKGWRSFKFYRDPRPPKIILWMVKKSHGFIKSEQKASHILVGATILLVSLAFLLAAFGSLKHAKSSNPLPDLIHRPQPKTSLLHQKPRTHTRYRTPMPTPVVSN